MPVLNIPRPSYKPKMWPTPPGCVLYLEGQQDPQSGTIRDLSGYNNHGTITDASWVRLPSGVRVNSFDGTDDKITITSTASLKVTRVSLKIWVKVTSAFENGDRIIQKKSTGAWVAPYEDYALMLIAPTTFRFSVGVGVANAESDFTSFVIGTWYCVVGTFDGTNQRIYVNGNLADTDNLPGDLEIGDGAIAIAAQPALNTFTPIDTGLVVIFNRALSATEIANTFNQERHLFGV